MTKLTPIRRVAIRVPDSGIRGWICDPVRNIAIGARCRTALAGINVWSSLIRSLCAPPLLRWYRHRRPKPGVLLLGTTVACLLNSPAACATPIHGQMYGDWTIDCHLVHPSRTNDAQAAAPAGVPECFLVQDRLLKKGGKRVLRMIVGYFRTDSDDIVALFTMPLGIALPPGATLQIDDLEAIRFPFERCGLEGCDAGLKLTPSLRDQLEHGTRMAVTFHDSGRRPITMPLSLKGFTEGLKSLRQDPSAR